MPTKRDNVYQHAEIILDRMIKTSGLSQNKFAQNVLGIGGANVSGAKKSGKIPDRWFEIIQEKFGVSKAELCNPSASPDGEKVEDPIEQAMDKFISQAPVLTRQIEAQMEDFFQSVRASFTNPQSLNSHQLQTPITSPFDAEMDRFFELIKEWWAEEKGKTPHKVDEFREEFKAAFPAIKDWLRKRGGAGDKGELQ